MVAFFLLFFASGTPPLHFATETRSVESGRPSSERAYATLPGSRPHAQSSALGDQAGIRRGPAQAALRARDEPPPRAARRTIAGRKERRRVVARTLGRSQAWPLGCPGTRRGAWTVGRTAARALDNAIRRSASPAPRRGPQTLHTRRKRQEDSDRGGAEKKLTRPAQPNFGSTNHCETQQGSKTASIAASDQKWTSRTRRRRTPMPA